MTDSTPVSALHGSASTAKLTHFGRKSRKPYQVTVWFAEIDGVVWIGSLDDSRSWVRNLEATGRAAIDLGNGPVDVRCTCCKGGTEVERFGQAIRAKYPIRARLLDWFVRGRRCAFRLEPDATK